MSTPYPPTSTSRTEAMSLLRDAFAVALMLVGLALLVWGAFAIDWRAGTLVVAVLLIAAGVALGYRRDTR